MKAKIQKYFTMPLNLKVLALIINLMKPVYHPNNSWIRVAKINQTPSHSYPQVQEYEVIFNSKSEGSVTFHNNSFIDPDQDQFILPNLSYLNRGFSQNYEKEKYTEDTDAELSKLRSQKSAYK